MAELNEISVILLLGFFFFLFAQDQVDLIPDSHTFVLFIIIDAVSYWVSGLSLDQTFDLFLLLVHGFLSCHKLFELIDKVELLLIFTIFTLCSTCRPLYMLIDFLLVAVLLHLLCLLFGLKALIEYTLQDWLDLQLL